MVAATGTGIAPPTAINAAQAEMLARRAAVADAYRQLAEEVAGVQVDAESTVQRAFAAVLAAPAFVPAEAYSQQLPF